MVVVRRLPGGKLKVTQHSLVEKRIDGTAVADFHAE
jgi:hypothetical protein